MLRATGTIKISEQDIYETGCTGQSTTEDLAWGGNNYVYEAPTLGLLLEKIKDAFDVTADDLLLDSCDEPGRLDVQRMEDANGNVLSADEAEQWKAGRFTAFLACYTFDVVSLAPVTMTPPKFTPEQETIIGNAVNMVEDYLAEQFKGETPNDVYAAVWKTLGRVQ